MTIKEIRNRTGMTQKAFAQKYQIPLQTLKQWECDPECKSFRQPPEYVVYILLRLVSVDFGMDNEPIDRADALLRAAEETRYHADHWLRYLRKEFDGGECRLNDDQIRKILDHPALTMYQRISFQRAVEKGTYTNRYITSLSEKATASMLESVIQRNRQV